MKKILTIQGILLTSGCYREEKVNPMHKMPFINKAEITTEEFLTEKAMPPQDRLWFLINSCELNDEDKDKLVEVFKELHPKYFDIPRQEFNDYVRAFNRLFYKEKKLSKFQVEKIIGKYLK